MARPPSCASDSMTLAVPMAIPTFASARAGSDVAIETADVALAGDNLNDIADVVQISRRMMSVVRQNYGLSLGVNSLGLVLAGRLNPILAAVLHNLSTILRNIAAAAMAPPVTERSFRPA